MGLNFPKDHTGNLAVPQDHIAARCNSGGHLTFEMANAGLNAIEPPAPKDPTAAERARKYRASRRDLDDRDTERDGDLFRGGDLLLMEAAE